jgi:hypothetical protein
VTKKVYATERIVFAEFEVRYTCPDETGACGPATLIVQGDGSYGAVLSAATGLLSRACSSKAAGICLRRLQ